ncbi:FAD-dependent oxidoreductase [Neobacillus drentensis]|uniref:FAD-dependent oxidoreductase n=1 Tax=Neobacillus drentensis TaxID=220684 RepID=UPI0028677BF4|nr:FAD-dependent oxidoreductase [Neobacillus drentensis]MDR7238347.1 glycine/D-amino acid oxidase-like deaminating enzyme/nitrite reductase/ring-hydroxylating ferredoxin subunit [Neobacillus drentensis]
MSSTEKMPKFPKTYWREIELPAFNTLEQDLSVDVAIVGAGITGITAAYLLSKEGLKVSLLEAGSVLNGTTGHTTAKLTAQHDIIYDELINHFGKEKARLYYESHMNAIRFVESSVAEKGIDCDFSKQDAFVYTTTDESVEKLKTEWEAYKSLEIDGALKDTIPFHIPAKGALVMHNQAQYHPLKFLKALLEDAVKAGCSVYENTVASDIEDDDTEPKVVTKSGHRVTCKQVIIASHFPFYDKPGLYFARMYASRSYAIGIKTDKDYPGGMYISADTPPRSIRYTPLDGEKEKILIIGGENHKTGQGMNTLKHYEALQAFAEEVFGIKEYDYRWSAQDMVTLDKLPYIGHYTEGRENVFVATGYKKWGMTTGILAGHLLTDYIMKRDNPYMELYTPSRFQADPDLKSVITTNADVAKHLIKGKLEYTDRSPDDLQVGEGSVVMYNGKRAGAYKDENGKLYVVDTTCTHLGCECEWNHAEKSWDCPCHGSRYAYSGDVIEGPTKKALELLAEE